MSSKVGAICVAVFLLAMVATLALPTFPPARVLYEFLKISQTKIVIIGVPLAVVIDGVTNGLFWLVICAAVYGLISSTSHASVLPPMPRPAELRTPSLESTLVDCRTMIPPALTVDKRRRNRLVLDVEMIEGIGSVRGALLKKLGVGTVDDLLRFGASKRGQLRIANETGVSHEMVVRWISRGDLLRVAGVSTQYSELLESAGVSSVADLSKRNPSSLHRMLKLVNKEKKLVKRIPPVERVIAWVTNARSLLAL